MLASSALVAACQAVNTSVDRFEQAGAYQLLHTHLVCQSLHHVRDDDQMTDVHELLHCQLQASGRPSLPTSDDSEPKHDLDQLLERFDDVPARDLHTEYFTQDGGDDDDYYE